MKSPNAARQSIERVLMRATEPLNPQQIAERSDLSLNTVRLVMSNVVCAKRAQNVGTKSAGLYVWRGAKVAAVPVPATTVSRIGGVYVPPKPAPVRDGADDAYSLPSLVDGQRIQRARPIILTGAK